MLLFLQNFMKLSSSCASPCYIAIVYIVMNKGEIITQIKFLSIITPRNLIQDSILGNLNRILHMPFFMKK